MSTVLDRCPVRGDDSGPVGGPVPRDLLDARSASALRASASVHLDPHYLSLPEPIDFPTTNQRTAHALYYPPKNEDYQPVGGELPPLIVTGHGGPTAAATAALNLQTQFWTSRGFALVDVDYGGSTGYGRAYRQQLKGMWGVVDVDDAVHAALALAGAGKIDGRRMAISGGSAGGYTALCAVTFKDVFQTAASLYGVSDPGSSPAGTGR
jgi:dipeptidyl aminopeptidase/acylaminoacyl peptidase